MFVYRKIKLKKATLPKESVFLLLKKGKHFSFFLAPFIFSNTQSLFLQNQLEAEQEQEHFSGPINFRYFFSFVSFMFLSSSS
jgi:hypothetical protein